MGGARELFRGEGAELYLVDGDESVLMQRGDFVLLLVQHSHSNLAAVVAMVGDMEWPVGKDSRVNKTGDSGFSFSNLPADLRYSLALDNLQTADLQRLEGLLEHYSTYMHSVNEAADIWTRTARSTKSRSISNAQCNPSCSTSRAVQPMHQRCLETMAERMQQARRMSAVAKLFARSVERGVINASTHVAMLDTDASRGSSQAYTEVVLASVDAVARVMDAVETARKALLESTQAVSTELAQRKCGQDEGRRAAEGQLDAVGRLIPSGWTLNTVGLHMLFRTIASIHSKGDTASRSVSRSAQSGTDVSCCLQLSSSSDPLPSASSNFQPAALSSPTVDSAALTQVRASRAPGAAMSSPTLDKTPRATLHSPTPQPHANDLSPDRRSRGAQPAAVQAQPLAPRFYGAALPPPRLSAAAPALSLSAAYSVAGPLSSISFRPYIPQARPSPASTSMSMELSPTPCPPRPPSRSPN